MTFQYHNLHVFICSQNIWAIWHIMNFWTRNYNKSCKARESFWSFHINLQCMFNEMFIEMSTLGLLTYKVGKATDRNFILVFNWTYKYWWIQQSDSLIFIVFIIFATVSHSGAQEDYVVNTTFNLIEILLSPPPPYKTACFRFSL